MSSYHKFKSPNEIHREITRKMRNREKVLPFQDDADDNFNESPNNLENHVKTNVKEAEKFHTFTKKLFQFASTRAPFECKDIKTALTEIRALQNNVLQLQKDQNVK